MLARRLAPAISTSILLALTLTRPAAAQTTAPAAWRSTPASLLKSTLRSVALAQSRHLGGRGSYATSVSVLDVTLEPGVRVEILAVGPSGWHARATHRDQPGRSCVIFVGRIDGVESPRTESDREMAGEEGVPLCDRMR
jgi:hypothetical protein